jgi:hypothetical protein
MVKMIKPIPTKEEEEEIEIEEETKPIFKEEETKEEKNIIVQEEEKKIENEENIISKPKPKRTKTMTDEAKKQLQDARKKSLETRRANALKRKQEKEEKELNNKKYIDEIENLKNELKLLKEEKTKPIPTKEVVEKSVNKIDQESQYKFSLDDMEFYATSLLKKTKEIEHEQKLQRRKQIKDKYFMNFR